MEKDLLHNFASWIDVRWPHGRETERHKPRAQKKWGKSNPSHSKANYDREALIIYISLLQRPAPRICLFLSQNFLNESLKYIDKVYPASHSLVNNNNNNGPASSASPSQSNNNTPTSLPGHLGGLSSLVGVTGGASGPPLSSASASAALLAGRDTKPLHIDAKTLLGHHAHHQGHGHTGEQSHAHSSSGSASDAKKALLSSA